MLRSIPFFRLPNVPQLLILEYLSMFQLFEFSCLSKRANKIAKSRKRDIKELYWYADYADATFTLEIIDYDDYFFNIHIPIDIQIVGNGMIAAGGITFEGRQLLMARNGIREMDIGEKGSSKEERSELFEKLTEHFMRMFNVETYTLSVVKAADLTKCFMWKYTKTLEMLCVDNRPDVLTSGKMEFILGELTVTDSLRIESRVAQGFQWTEPLNKGQIVLRDGRFLSLDVYLNSKVTRWQIRNEPLPSTYLNAIMTEWLDGGLEQLESFKMETPYGSVDSEHRLTEALEGIQTVPWDRTMRPRGWRDIDAAEGRDMRRNDGKLATAGVIHGHFYFVIWNSDQLQPELANSDEDDEEVEVWPYHWN